MSHHNVPITGDNTFYNNHIHPANESLRGDTQQNYVRAPSQLQLGTRKGFGQLP